VAVDQPVRSEQVSLAFFSALDHLECPRCHANYDPDCLTGLCVCGSPLLARYDLERAGRMMARSALSERPSSLWRYHEVLPVRGPANVITMGEGMTPLTPLPRLGSELGMPRLFMKDEGVIPTGTFKARGAAVGVARARELGARAVAMPTNGNAGAAWAAYAARAGLRTVIAMPEEAPLVNRAECLAAGAELHLVRGHIGDAARLIADAISRSDDLFDVSTLKEPYRIEGKKTMGYEIAEQFNWKLPDVIVYPTGGGVGLIGIYKALLELQQLGWVSGPLPRLVSVQADGCAPIVRAFEAKAAVSAAWAEPCTVAFGINVPKALGDFLVLEALYATGGTAIAVTDQALLADQRECARVEGLFICPEGAAAITAVRQLRSRGWLDETDATVLLNTGTGLKYTGTVLGDRPGG
jgi:threonine synthase